MYYTFVFDFILCFDNIHVIYTNPGQVADLCLCVSLWGEEDQKDQSNAHIF